MNKALFVGLFLFIGLISSSQNSNFSAELNFPITADNNFVGQNFNGYIDAGLRYKFIDLDILKIGAAINAGYYKNTKEESVQPFDVTLFMVNPKLFFEFDIESISKVHPSLGIGYSFLNFKANANDFNNPNTKVTENESGINLNLRLAYDITNKLFVAINYDFVKISTEDGVPDTTFNTNINIIKLGLGYNF